MLSQFWTRRLKKFWADFHMITNDFTDSQRQNVSKADLSMILATSQKEQVIGYLDALRVLFFPKPADCNDNKITGIPVEKGWWSKASAGQYKQSVPPWSPAIVHELTSTHHRYTIAPPALGEHSFRRPGFLRVLNRTQYVEFYEQMQEKDPTMLSKAETPEGLTKSIVAVGQPLSQLYRHILFWYNPDF
jgi:hypothetical protein